jgi:hypothetical protein
MRVESEFQSLFDGHHKLNATHSSGTLTNSSNAGIGVTYQVARLPYPNPILNIDHRTDKFYSPDFIRSHRSDPSSSSSLSAHKWTFTSNLSKKEVDALQLARSDVHSSFGDAEGNGNVSVKPVQGPARPPGLEKGGDGEGLSELHMRREMEEDERESRRRFERDDRQKRRREERDEEKDKRGTGRDRMLEKRREVNEGNRKFAEASLSFSLV